jgi:hypothetical protein
MRARALAFYLLVFQGSLAVGSGVWGEVARHWGVRAALLMAAGAMVAGLGAGWRMKLSWNMPGTLRAPVEAVAAE